jgi:hypothetical protein
MSSPLSLFLNRDGPCSLQHLRLRTRITARLQVGYPTSHLISQRLPVLQVRLRPSILLSLGQPAAVRHKVNPGTAQILKPPAMVDPGLYLEYSSRADDLGFWGCRSMERCP